MTTRKRSNSFAKVRSYEIWTVFCQPVYYYVVTRANLQRKKQDLKLEVSASVLLS